MEDAGKLRVARAYRGLTQAQLAEKAGVSRETVSRLERGGRARLKTAAALARALEMDFGLVFPDHPANAAFLEAIRRMRERDARRREELRRRLAVALGNDAS